MPRFENGTLNNNKNGAEPKRYSELASLAADLKRWAKENMKLAYIVLSLGLTVGAFSADTPKIKKISVCDLLASHLAFAGTRIEVTGLIGVSFEDSSLHCLEEKNSSDMFGTWVDWDTESIRKKSPDFLPILSCALEKAKKWQGGLSGTMDFKARFEVSDTIIKTGPDGVPHRLGFGRLGAFGFRVVVLEVVDYKPNQPVQRTRADARRSP